MLSFNFRGVMRSGGSFSAGHGEVRDAAAAITRAREAAEGPTLVCGWSFGANVALREAVQDERVAALALVGLPLGESAVDLPDLSGPSELRAFEKPVLLASGQGDTISPRPELETLARRLSRAEVAILAGTDHFFWHRELAARIGDFADQVLAYRRSRRRTPLTQMNGRSRKTTPNSLGATTSPRNASPAHAPTQSSGFPHHGRTGRSGSIPSSRARIRWRADIARNTAMPPARKAKGIRMSTSVFPSTSPG